jgi:hypothetical protein
VSYALYAMTSRFMAAMAVEFDHRFVEAQAACPWPGPCLICRWYSPAFLDGLGEPLAHSVAKLENIA